MSFRTTFRVALPVARTALTLLLAGCSGTTGLVNLDAGATTDSAVSADASQTVEGPDGALAADSTLPTAPADAGSPDSAAPVGSGAADATAESAGPGGGCVGITVTDDAGYGSCAVTPDDLACTTADDCRAYEIPVCACAAVPVVAVNRAAAVACAAPHCQPPSADAGCFGSPSYQGQDCVVVSSPGQIVVDCVNGRCTSHAASPTH
jgi:hypothetical protein